MIVFQPAFNATWAAAQTYSMPFEVAFSVVAVVFQLKSSGFATITHFEVDANETGDEILKVIKNWLIQCWKIFRYTSLKARYAANAKIIP